MMDKVTALRQALEKNSAKHFSELLQSGVELSESDLRALLIESVVTANAGIVELILSFGARTGYEDIYAMYFIPRRIEFSSKIKEDGGLLIIRLDYPDLIVRPVNSHWEKYVKLADFSECLKTFTPLAIAVLCANIGAIDILLQYGADPLKKCLQVPSSPCMDNIIPLKSAFSRLPVISIENMIKYAALKVDNASVLELHCFLMHFFEKNVRAYLKFALRCVAEVKILKKLVIDVSSSLFDFIVSQDKKLYYFLDDNEIINNIINVLSSTAIPIYRGVVFKKFREQNLVNHVLQVCDKRWGAKCEDKNTFLNVHCVENVCRYLNKEELGSLLVAFKSIG